VLTKYEYKKAPIIQNTNTNSGEFDIIRDGFDHVPVQYDERDKQMDKLKKAAYEDEIKRMNL
jgi:hypothetical protein